MGREVSQVFALTDPASSARCDLERSRRTMIITIVLPGTMQRALRASHHRFSQQDYEGMTVPPFFLGD